MVRSLIALIAGFCVGALSLWLATRSPRPEDVGFSTPVPSLVRCEEELKMRDAELAQLKSNLVAPPQVVPQTEVAASDNVLPTDDPQRREQANSWRISAIERFIPLSDEQRTRLQAKFTEDRRAQDEGRESNAESLDDIVGEDEARGYREQVNAAFQRVRDEELEKNSLWMARKLGLSAEQEQRMRSVFEEVEQAVEAEYPPTQVGSGETAQTRVLRMIAENKRRVELRANRLRQVLAPDQYEAYMRAESESSASDMAVFHGDGAGGATDDTQRLEP